MKNVSKNLRCCSWQDGDLLLRRDYKSKVGRYDMQKRKQPKFKYIPNSLYTNSRGYDPVNRPDILRVRIADGAKLVDRLQRQEGVA